MACPRPTAQKTTARTNKAAMVRRVASSKLKRLRPALSPFQVEVNSPGHSEKSVAAATQNTVRTTQTHAPVSPPGTTNGRLTLGYLRRSVMRAGKMRMYEKVVVEITRPSTTAKNDARLPLVSSKARTMKMVEMTPERTLTTIGVPNLLEKEPSCWGPEPATAPMAMSRSDPMSQVVPAESNEKTTAAPTMVLKKLAAP